MKIKLSASELCLAENHPLRLAEARGLDVVCLAGTLWITCSGRIEDIFLGAGECYRIPDQHERLLEAIGEARIRLRPAPPSPTSWADRLKGLVAGNSLFRQKRLTADLSCG